MAGAEASLNGLSQTSRRSSTTVRDFATSLNDGLSQGAIQARQNLANLNREARSAARTFGTNSQEAMSARNAISEYALSLDDATFKQVYMKGQLGQTEASFNSQANSIKLNTRMTSLMGNQTEILTRQMQGLARHGIRPEMMMPPSTIGQFRLLNETMRASNTPINMLSAGFRRFGNSMESTIKGWSAQKMAMKLAQGDMVRYGLLLRGITAGQASLGMAFPIVGMAAALCYGLMFKAALNSDAQLKKLAETVGGKLGKAFDPVIKAAGAFLKVFLSITGKVADLIIKFNEAHPTIAKFAGAVLFLLPVMTLLLLPLTLGIGLINGWKVAINGLWVTIGPLVTTIGTAAASFLTIAAIVAVVAGAFLYLWKTNEGFRNGCIKTWDSIKAKATEVFGGLATLFGKTLPNAYKAGGMEGLFSKMGEIFKNLLTNINTLLPQFAKKGTELLSKISEGIIAGLPVFIQTASTILQTWLQTWANNLPILLNCGLEIIMALANGIIASMPLMINTLMNIFTTIINFVTANIPILLNCGIQILTALVNGIVNSLPMIIDAAIRIINTLVDFIIANLPMMIDTAVKIITTLGNAIIANLPKLIEAALQMILALANGIAQNLPKIMAAGVKIVTALVKALIQAAPQLLGAAVKLIAGLVKGLISGIPQVAGAMGKVVAGMLKALSGKVGSFVSVGTSIINGLARGITSGIGVVTGAIGRVISGAIAAAKSKLKINSPSKVFMAFGQGTGEGLVMGIDKEGANVAKASRNLAANAIGGYNAKLKGISVKSSNNNQQNVKGGETNIIINSSRPLSPAEVAREVQKTQRRLALSL